MLRRETARLRAIFRRVLLASAAAGSAVDANACTEGAGSEQDAAAPEDATRDAGPDATGDGSGDADAGPLYPPGCAPAPAVVYDAGAEAAGCVYRVSLPCGLPSFVTHIAAPNCAIDLGTCEELCTGPAFPFLSCEIANGVGCDDDAMAFVAADGEAIAVDCDKCSIMGRRPTGLVRARAKGGSALGAFFGHAAHLEAASVYAFAALAGELRGLGAPAELVRAAERGERDEERHTRLTRHIARLHGTEPPVVRVERRRARSTSAMAIDNAVEGCVRETYGALAAAWQAAHARDARIARTMASIARDEARHAALSWAIARWVEPRLGVAAWRRLVAARRQAIRTLRRQARATVPAVLVERAGVPRAAAARRMIDALQAALWSSLRIRA
jgi:hypothetical protein